MAFLRLLLGVICALYVSQTHAQCRERAIHLLRDLADEQPGTQAVLEGGHTTLRGCLERNLLATNTPLHFAGDANFSEIARCWSDWDALIPDPAAVVDVGSTQEVALTVLCAAAYDKMACARGNKHGWECAAGCSGGGVVVNLARMDKAIVDVDSKTVDMQGGSTVGIVFHELYKFGMWTSLGGISSVGMGLILGCGRGWQHALYGLSCEQVLEVEYVNNRGQTMLTNAELDPDMFWLVRGGGGGIFPGIVTRMTLRAYDIPSPITRYNFQYAREALPDVLEVWTQYQGNMDRRMFKHVGAWGASRNTLLGVSMDGYMWGGTIEQIQAEFQPVTTELLRRGHNYTLDTETNLDWLRVITKESGPDGTNITNRNQGWGTSQNPGSTAVEISSMAGYMNFTRAIGQEQLDFLNDPNLRNGAPDYSLYFTVYSVAGAPQDIAPDATAYFHRTIPYYFEMTFQWSGQNLADQRVMLAARTPMVNRMAELMTSPERRAMNKPVGSLFNYRDNNMPQAPTPRQQLESYFDANLPRILEIRCARDPNGVFGIPEIPLGCSTSATPDPDADSDDPVMPQGPGLEGPGVGANASSNGNNTAVRTAALSTAPVFATVAVSALLS